MVDPEMVRQLVFRVWQDVQAGRTAEHHKVELKREWWDFGNRLGKEEFAKDLAMMANTPGGQGYLVIGIDEKTREVLDSPITLTGRQTAGIDEIARNQIVPSVEWDLVDVDLEGKNIAVLVVAKSSRRPHVVDQYGQRKNCVFLRGASGLKVADRWDLDDMYGDRNREVRRFLQVANQELRVTTTGSLSGFNLRVVCWTGGSPLFLLSGSLKLYSGDQMVQELHLWKVDRKDLPSAHAPREANVVDLMFPIGNVQPLLPYANNSLAYQIVLNVADGHSNEEAVLTGSLVYRR